ncbi:MAG: VWA domain-containing protein [Cycloclasticus sp.]|nr:VWA domain-containing protein [Cycloclasticus sp.]
MKFTTIIAAMLLAAPFGAGAQEPAIEIIDRTAQNSPLIFINSKFNFEQDISLKLNTDPRFSISDLMIETISKIGMVDANGIFITSGFDIDLENALVVAFSDGSSEIIKIAQLPDGFQVVGSFKDINGNFVSPPKSSLAVYNTNGEKLCFDYKTVQQSAPKMAFTLLLDRSGSMAANLGKVKQTANDFLNILPQNALCAVASFDTKAHYAHKNYQACNGGGFGFDKIKAGGGTDIYAPLREAYQTLSIPYFSVHQKAVIIITDGYTLSDEKRKKDLLALKGSALTFVYFIGGNKRDDLEDITDHFIAQGGDVAQSLSQYFSAIGQAYNAQKVLSVKACASESNANP